MSDEYVCEVCGDGDSSIFCDIIKVVDARHGEIYSEPGKTHVRCQAHNIKNNIEIKKHITISQLTSLLIHIGRHYNLDDLSERKKQWLVVLFQNCAQGLR